MKPTFISLTFIVVFITTVIGSYVPSQTAQAQQATAPLYFATMTHMEGNFVDDRDQAVFLQHVEQLRFGMTLAEAYDAKLTIESEKPFARANTIWGLNIMQEVIDRGHGVGTHCDIGFHEPLMSVDEFAAMFALNKSLVDALVGPENNRGCSGGGGVNDYVLAASQAGFLYLDGIVGMHYLSMPLENRPDPTWTDAYIQRQGFHFNAPVDLNERIYPFLVIDAQDFVPDAGGVLVISSGELGRLDWLAELAQSQTCRQNCPFNDTDVDALIQQINEVAAMRDKGRVAKLTVHIPAALFIPENEFALRYFFAELQALQNDGVIQWATQGEVYDAYMAWNNPQ